MQSLSLIEEPRDFLSEAQRILEGESLLLAQREHLVALCDWYESGQLTDDAISIILEGESNGLS